MALFSGAAVGKAIVQLRGLAIGGLLSASALSVLLGSKGLALKHSPDLQRRLREKGFHIDFANLVSVIGIMRYVDDICDVSNLFCSECCSELLAIVYPSPSSFP